MDLFNHVLEEVPENLLSHLRPLISEIFLLYHHRGNLSLFLHPLLEKLLLNAIEVKSFPPSPLTMLITNYFPAANQIPK